MKTKLKAVALLVAGLGTSANVLAAEQTFSNPRMVTVPYGYSLPIGATSEAEFCLAQGFDNYKNAQIAFFPESSGAPHNYALPINVLSADTDWKMVQTSGGYSGAPYVSSITCYTPEPPPADNNNPTVTINGIKVPIAEKAELNGWSLDSYVIYCSNQGLTPGSQDTKPLYHGVYGVYNVASGSGWEIRYQPNNGDSVNVLSSVECGGPW